MSLNKTDVVILGFYVGSDAIGAARPYSWASWAAHAQKRTVILSGPFRSHATCLHPFLTHESLISPFFISSSRLYRLLFRFSYFQTLSRSWHKLYKCLSNLLPKASLKSNNPSSQHKLRSGIFSYRMPCLADFWYFSALYRLLSLRPRIVIASHSPYVVFLVALTYKILNPSSKFVVDYRDMWSLSRVYHGIPLLRGIERLLERLVLRVSDKIVVVSHGQSSMVSSLDTTITPVVIPNTSSLETFSVLKTTDSKSTPISP